MSEVEQAAAERDSFSASAALGILDLVVGDVAEAVRRLEAASAREPANAVIWSDLAAAYLTAAERLQHDEYWVRALASAERALLLRPQMPEAVFNRALALEGLELADEASRAWMDYLALESKGPWAKNARARHLAITSRSSPVVEWALFRDSRLLQKPPSTPDHVAIHAVASRQYLREWIERQLLPSWAEALLRGDVETAAHEIRLARDSAEILRLAGGDAMPRLGIAAIDIARSASGDDSAVLRDLARAHLRYRDVLMLFDEGSVTSAAETFREIRQPFSRVDSPYARWGDLYEAVVVYAARRPDEARIQLNADLRSDDTLGLRYLHGRRLWLLGLIELNAGRFEHALDYYQRALHNLEAVGENDDAAAVAALLGESLSSLGARREAWRYQRIALKRTPFLSVSRRKHLILQTAGLMCLNEGLPEAALAFQDAVIRTAEGAARRPSSLVEGYLHRARIHHRIGARTAASQDLGRARELVPSVREDSLRRREEAEILTATAELFGLSAPADAIAAASRALDHFGDVAGGFRLVGLYLARGRAHIARGSLSEAERDFGEAIRHFEVQRRYVKERQYRQTLFQNGWQAYAEMVRLQVASRNDQTALNYAERARARSLLEAVVRADDVESLPVAALRLRLPRDAAVLFFVVLPDRLLTWSITRDGIKRVERPLDAARLTRTVDEIRRQLEIDQRLSLRTETLLRELYDITIAPLEDIRARYSTLVIVPDGALHALPFSALIQPTTGRYLIETNVLAVAPSLNLLVRGLARPMTGRKRALIAGNSFPRMSSGAALPSLPFVREETEAIASVYRGDARLLFDGSATIEALLRELPSVDILHYAGHAIVDPESPDRSRLLLAATGSNEGILFVATLHGLHLPRHPVIVLAACSTHVGDIAVGEGVQSIARPFLAAGASSVIATLWDVRDRAASRLFRAFHAKVATGVPPAQALAEAQRDALLAPDMSSPSNWAWALAIGGVGSSDSTISTRSIM